MADFKHDVANAHLVMGKMPKKHKLSAEEHQELKHAQAVAYCAMHTACRRPARRRPDATQICVADQARRRRILLPGQRLTLHVHLCCTDNGTAA